MTAPGMAANKLARKVRDVIQIVGQNDIKALKKVMKTKFGKHLKIVQNGLLAALEFENCEALKMMLTSGLGDVTGEITSFLHYAVLGSKTGILQTLLADKRFDVNQVSGNSDGMTPLMVAVADGKVEMVQILLDHPDININAVDTNKEWSALEYSLSIGDIDILQMLLKHRDVSHGHIQDLLLLGLSAISLDDHSINIDVLDILLKKTFENEYKLNNLVDGKHEFHEYFDILVAEEYEMKMREKYYNGDLKVSMESLGNRVFGISIDVLQASILRCKCDQCAEIKQCKKLVYQTFANDQLRLVKVTKKEETKKLEIKRGDLNKQSKVKCIIDAKALSTYRGFEVKSEEFITMPLPDIFKHILYHGGHETGLDGIIKGTKTIQELNAESHLSKPVVKNFSPETEDNKSPSKKDANGNIIEEKKSKSASEFSSLCWSCSETQTKLFKCGGCRKARYCSDKCIADDWQVHMNYCILMQEKRQQKKSQIKERSV